MGPMLLYLILAVMKIKKRNKKKIMSKLKLRVEDCVISKHITASSACQILFNTNAKTSSLFKTQKRLFVTLGKQHLSR